VEVLDEVVQLFDQVVSATESRAQVKMTRRLAERGRAAEDRLVLLGEILPVLADEGVPAERVVRCLHSPVSGTATLDRTTLPLAVASGPARQHGGVNRGAAAHTSTSAAAPTSAHAGADTVSLW
jgi:hypothetical protein